MDEADDTARFVPELAERHELVCHVPQTGATSIPDFVRTGTLRRLSADAIVTFQQYAQGDAAWATFFSRGS
ncbi:hypothetical protein AB0K00_07450 [Dactylosporangium sp. NPDC049525]|uniref:hypothetical protein n=1 Tax=Dactylosporangium sp. NPDC049525 TaxID=3154730 RepID=UPI0034384EBB